jgi:hypothetical protein
LVKQLDIQSKKKEKKIFFLFLFSNEEKKTTRTSFTEDCSREYNRRLQLTERSKSMQIRANCNNDDRRSLERLNKDAKP